MPGAGSARRRGFLAKIAPKDGTVIGGIMPGAIMGPLLDEKSELAVRSDQGALPRHRQQRHARLRDAGRHPRSRPSRTRARSKSIQFGAVSPNEFDATTTPTCTGTVGRDLRSGLRLSTARPRSASPWSAARWTASAAGTGRASRRRAPTGCATRRPTSWCRSALEPQRRAHQDGRAARLGLRQERRRPQDRRADHRPAGVPALLHRAAGNAAGAACRSCAPRSTPP